MTLSVRHRIVIWYTLWMVLLIVLVFIGIFNGLINLLLAPRSRVPKGAGGNTAKTEGTK